MQSDREATDTAIRPGCQRSAIIKSARRRRRPAAATAHVSSSSKLGHAAVQKLHLLPGPSIGRVIGWSGVEYIIGRIKHFLNDLVTTYVGHQDDATS